MEQLDHLETNFIEKQFPVVLVLDNITGEANIGSIFRLADAFGVQQIIFTGTEPNLQSNRLKRTARNTFKTVDFQFKENIRQALTELKSEHFYIAGLEITSESKILNNIHETEFKKIALVAGNERSGISAEALELCDDCYYIEMFGKNSSMNVANSIGIGLYEIINATFRLVEK